MVEMKLDVENVILILCRNFGFRQLYDDCVGQVVEVDPKEAYFYSAIVGSTYLNDIYYPFSPKSLQKVFNSAFSYNLITGLFDLDEGGKPLLRNSPSIHQEEYPFIANDPKYILPIEVDKSSNLLAIRSEIYSDLTKADKNPCNYLITTIRKNVSGYSMEPFCEYVACRYFRDLGYITENQIPLYYGLGTPDFGAFRLPELLDILVEKRFIDKGCFLIELASLSAFGFQNEERRSISNSTELTVGEVKTGARKTQINKYLSAEVFDKGFEMFPNGRLVRRRSGLITFDEQGKILVLEPKEYPKVDPEKQAKYLMWLENYLKYYLLANLSLQQLRCFLQEEARLRFWSTNEMIKSVNRLSFSRIVDAVAQHLALRKI